MRTFIIAVVWGFSLAIILPEASRAEFFGISYFNGDLWRGNEKTGGTQLIGRTYASRANSLARISNRYVATVSTDSEELIFIDTTTTEVSERLPLDFQGEPVDVRGLAFSPDGELYAITASSYAFRAPTLFTIDLATGSGTMIGPLTIPLPKVAYQSLAISPPRDPRRGLP